MRYIITYINITKEKRYHYVIVILNIDGSLLCAFFTWISALSSMFILLTSLMCTPWNINSPSEVSNSLFINHHLYSHLHFHIHFLSLRNYPQCLHTYHQYLQENHLSPPQINQKDPTCVTLIHHCTFPRWISPLHSIWEGSQTSIYLRGLSNQYPASNPRTFVLVILSCSLTPP